RFPTPQHRSPWPLFGWPRSAGRGSTWVGPGTGGPEPIGSPLRLRYDTPGSVPCAKRAKRLSHPIRLRARTSPSARCPRRKTLAAGELTDARYVEIVDVVVVMVSIDSFCPGIGVPLHPLPPPHTAPPP